MKRSKFKIAASGDTYGSVEVREREGYAIEVEGIPCFVDLRRSSVQEDRALRTGWTVTEATTGYAIGYGDTRKAAIEQAKRRATGPKLGKLIEGVASAAASLTRKNILVPLNREAEEEG